MYSDDENDKTSLSSTLEASSEYNPEKISEKTEIKKMIGHVIEELSEKEKQVLILYYYEDLTLKEIGEVLEVTESRVSQLHTKAIFKLRAKLKKLQKKLGKSH
jgi:RNA polymerase sigma factor for flagellar operon FliA